MPVSKSGKILAAPLAFMLLTAAADFKDLSTLQAAATYARKNLDQAETQYRADAEEVQRQQQVVNDQKKELDAQTQRLNEAKKNAEQSQQQYQSARNRYDRAQSELDAALKKK